MINCSLSRRSGSGREHTCHRAPLFCVFDLKLVAAAEITFEERPNFRAFKLVACSRDRLDDVRKAVPGKAELPDADTAWISQDTLCRWPGVEHDTAWQQNFADTIDKA